MAREALRQRRLDLGFSQESLAQRLGVSTSTFGSWERGYNLPIAGFRPALARALEVTLPELGRLLSDDEPEAVAEGLQVADDWLGHYTAVEQGSGAIDTFQFFVVPGLLQTRDYATAIERAHFRPEPNREIERRVRGRLARQQVLARRPPLRLSVVLDHSVLTRVAGDGEVTYYQLRHLADLAERPNITIRVLPPDAQAFPAASGAFTLFRTPLTYRPFLACAGGFTSATYIERQDDVALYTELFEHLTAVALSPGSSVELIRTTAEEQFC